MIQLDSSFFKSELVTKYKRFVEEKEGRCTHPMDGVAVLLYMLALSLDGVHFIDMRDFIEKTDAPKRTGKNVWEYCIENNILSLGEKGYSAKEWAIENGFIPQTIVSTSKRKIEFVQKRVVPADLGLDEADLRDLKSVYKNPENTQIAVHLFYDWMIAKKESGSWNPKTNIKKQLLCSDRDWYKKALNLVSWDRDDYLEKIQQVANTELVMVN